MNTNASNRAKAFKLLDNLIKELDEICQKAEKESSPGLVDLKRVLNHALYLQKTITKKDANEVNWRLLASSVCFLIQIAKKIHSLFFNCFIKWLFENAIWKSHKTLTCFQ
jgi:hypothetical protein